jgi:hypothetical protein
MARYEEVMEQDTLSGWRKFETNKTNEWDGYVGIFSVERLLPGTSVIVVR